MLSSGSSNILDAIDHSGLGHEQETQTHAGIPIPPASTATSVIIPPGGTSYDLELEQMLKLKVYKNIAVSLHKKIIRSQRTETKLLNNLRAHVQSMMALDTILSLVHSNQYCAQLMAVRNYILF